MAGKNKVFFENEADMSAEDFRRFQKLFDFGGLDPFIVFNYTDGAGYEQRKKICKSMKDFTRKHGDPTAQLRLNQEFAGEFIPFLFSAEKEWDGS